MIKEFYFKYRIFIIPSVVSLICAVIIIFVIIPQVIELIKEKEQITALNQRIQLLNNKATELGNLDEVKLQQDLITGLTILPISRDVPQAMSALQHIITKSNLSLQSTSYSSTSKSNEQNSFSLTISAIGSVSSTSDFLNNLREGSRIFKVDAINLRQMPKSSLISADLPLTVFYQPAPITVLTIDQPVAKIGVKEEELLKNLSKFIFQQPTFSTASAIPVGKADPFQ